MMDKDLQMVFYTGNNKIDQSDYWYCSLKTNLPTSLKEITPLELSAIR
ncbi:MAG: hypothetical protein LBD75_01310 [Candidatus Peribacteria bacterium]|nr:hypothetical protein [Candidatus Peribacteria bacterium]